MPTLNDEHRLALRQLSNVIRGATSLKFGASSKIGEFDIKHFDMDRIVKYSRKNNADISKDELLKLLIIFNDLSTHRNQIFEKSTENALKVFKELRRSEFPGIPYFDIAVLVADHTGLSVEDASVLVTEYIDDVFEGEEDDPITMASLFEYLKNTYDIRNEKEDEGKGEGAEEKDKDEDEDNQDASGNLMTDEMLEKQKTLTEINKLLDQSNYLEKQILKVNQNVVRNVNPNITQAQDLSRFKRRMTESDKYNRELFEKIRITGELNEKQQYINRQQYANYLFGIPSMSDNQLKYSDEFFTK